MAPASTSSNRAVMIVLSYLWILALVPLLVEKSDEDIQWHARHGLVLLLAEIILRIALIMLATFFGLTGLGITILVINPLVWLGILIVHVLAIVKGLSGGRLLIPGISEYANRF